MSCYFRASRVSATGAEECACECYAVIKAATDKAIPPIVAVL
jgi:hypothetical protein